LFLLAVIFRCADERLSNGENGPIADGHRATVGRIAAEAKATPDPEPVLVP